MSTKRSLLQFLVMILMPALLILLGAGLAAAGMYSGWTWLIWAGLVVVGAGILWGLALFLYAES